MTSRYALVLVSLAFSLTSLQLTGCGRTARAKVKGRPEVHRAGGLVTLHGKPVEGATVTFHRSDGKLSAVGITDDKGRYRLTTFYQFDGAAAGDYHVTVLKLLPESEVVAREEDPGYSNPEFRQQRPQCLLPTKYAQVSTTDLFATVAADGKNELHFALQGKLP